MPPLKMRWVGRKRCSIVLPKKSEDIDALRRRCPALRRDLCAGSRIGLAANLWRLPESASRKLDRPRSSGLREPACVGLPVLRRTYARRLRIESRASPANVGLLGDRSSRRGRYPDANIATEAEPVFGCVSM